MPALVLGFDWVLVDSETLTASRTAHTLPIGPTSRKQQHSRKVFSQVLSMPRPRQGVSTLRPRPRPGTAARSSDEVRDIAQKFWHFEWGDTKMGHLRPAITLVVCAVTVAFTLTIGSIGELAAAAPATSGACLLLQASEVRHLVRVPVHDGVLTKHGEGTGTVQVCKWEPVKKLNKSGLLVHFAVLVESGPDIAASYNEVKSNDNRNIPISGLGDDAFLETNDNLRILVGGRVLTVQIARYNQENISFKNVQGLLTAAARTALPRLNMVP